MVDCLNLKLIDLGLKEREVVRNINELVYFTLMGSPLWVLLNLITTYIILTKHLFDKEKAFKNCSKLFFKIKLYIYKERNK